MAQLRQYPAYPASHGVAQTRTDQSTGRTKETPPLVLPFFDDFSKPVNVIYADTNRWSSSNSVWINDGMAIHPPTLNVATFDGLNALGMPYNPNEVLLTGYTDTLMSLPIDLSETRVATAERSTVYLSFYYQWQGNVEPPDQKDFLELSFKTSTDTWETAMTIYPKDGVDPTVFYDTIIQLNGEQFFHEKFQFMFRTFGRLSGPFDAWHVDYVYLNKGRNVDDLSFPDRALATQLGPLFGKYRAMPRNHFLSNAQLTPPTFEIQNMKNEEASINFRTEGFFSSTNRETKVTSPSHTAVIGKATPIKITNGVFSPKEHVTVRMDTLPDINDPLQFPTDAGIDSTIIRLTIALQTKDNIPANTINTPVETDSTGDYTRNYHPIRFTTNDTLTADYILSDYFAYDDGVAEYAAGLIESGNLVAYEFEIDTVYGIKQDTLIGFDIYFPPYALTNNQTIDFFIYHEDEDNPGFPGELWLRVAAKRIQKKGINQFQRMEFLPALLIDEKKFYLGWQQPVAGKAMVGLDMSNDTGDKIFVNTDGAWYQNEDVRGSLMLRPVFGSGIIDSRVGIAEEETLEVYPNPNRGTFYIEGNASDLQIFSVTGEKISYASSAEGNRVEIRVDTKVPGVYILRYRHGSVMQARKVIVTR